MVPRKLPLRSAISKALELNRAQSPRYKQRHISITMQKQLSYSVFERIFLWKVCIGSALFRSQFTLMFFFAHQFVLLSIVFDLFVQLLCFCLFLLGTSISLWIGKTIEHSMSVFDIKKKKLTTTHSIDS